MQEKKGKIAGRSRTCRMEIAGIPRIQKEKQLGDKVQKSEGEKTRIWRMTAQLHRGSAPSEEQHGWFFPT